MSARIDTAAERARLDAQMEQARRDDSLERMVPSDLRRIIGGNLRALDEIDRLTAALAEAEDRGAAQMRERAAQAVIDAPDCSRLEAVFAITVLPLRDPGATP